MKNEFCAGGIIYRKNGDKIEIALILDLSGKWTFPKGHVEKNENLGETAIRECCEELDVCNLNIIKGLGNIDYYFKDKRANKNVLIHKIVEYFLIEAPEGSIIKPQQKEASDAIWVKVKDVDKLLEYKGTKKILSKALKYL